MLRPFLTVQKNRRGNMPFKDPKKAKAYARKWRKSHPNYQREWHAKNPGYWKKPA